MATALDDAALEAALHTACEQRDLAYGGARLIHHYSNAVYLLPAEDAIARIATDGETPERLRTTQTVTSWLAQDRGFAATAPLLGRDLVEVDDRTVVTFWTYYPQPDPGADGAEPFTSAHLGQLLHTLHTIGWPPAPLTRWEPLESLELALAAGTQYDAITPSELDWLRGRVRDIRSGLAELDWPLGEGLIHGDAWAGNLLWDTSTAPLRAVLGDWDRVSWGPREVDLVPTWHAAVRYGRDEAWIQDFVKHYDYDLRDWSGYQTLLDMRDLAQIPGPLRRSVSSRPHAAAMRQRFDAIRAGDRTATWVTL